MYIDTIIKGKGWRKGNPNRKGLGWSKGNTIYIYNTLQSWKSSVCLLSHLENILPSSVYIPRTHFPWHSFFRSLFLAYTRVNKRKEHNVSLFWCVFCLLTHDPRLFSIVRKKTLHRICWIFGRIYHQQKNKNNGWEYIDENGIYHKAALTASRLSSAALPEPLKYMYTCCQTSNATQDFRLKI